MRRALALLGLSIAISGCDSPDQFLSRLDQEWNALIVVLTGGRSPLAKPEAAPSVAARSLSASEAAAKAKQNSELLQEVLRVVYNRDLENRAEFGSLLDTLNQGASFEGLYNGFTHSSGYRKLEVSNPGSASAALDFFADELARTEALLATPTEFSANAAQPLSAPVQPVDTGVTETTYAAQPSPSPTPRKTAAEYKREFAAASVFTLKRVLGDELLKLIGELGKDPKRLQSWYGDWVVRMCALNVDFGIPLRNRSDALFHAQWLATADPDRVRWEVLNRVHRILNAKNASREGHP